MLDDKSNWIGLALLVLCGLSAGLMLGFINTGTLPNWDVPSWLYWTVIIGGLGVMIGGFFWSRRGPKLGNDVRSPRRWPWQKDQNRAINS